MISEDVNVTEEVEKVIEENPEEVDDYYGGEEGAMSYLVGQVLQNTNGNVSPTLVHKEVKEQLND